MPTTGRTLVGSARIAGDGRNCRSHLVPLWDQVGPLVSLSVSADVEKNSSVQAAILQQARNETAAEKVKISLEPTWLEVLKEVAAKEFLDPSTYARQVLLKHLAGAAERNREIH